MTTKRQDQGNIKMKITSRLWGCPWQAHPKNECNLILSATQSKQNKLLWNFSENLPNFMIFFPFWAWQFFGNVLSIWFASCHSDFQKLWEMDRACYCFQRFDKFFDMIKKVLKLIQPRFSKQSNRLTYLQIYIICT